MNVPGNMLKICTTSRETLVFRDGKPFGSAGNLTGGRIPWPMPSTIAGMVRSKIGFSRGEDYFDRGDWAKYQKNIAELRQLSVHSLPVHRPFDGNGNWELLFPAPADAAVFPSGEQLKIECFSFRPGWSDASDRCADVWINWLLPRPPRLDKPAARRPAFWHKSYFFDWLKEQAPQAMLFPSHLGVDHAKYDTRIHTAINADSGSADESRLFDAPGIRLGLKNGAGLAELGIAVFVEGARKTDVLTGPVHLGGERRVAYNDDFLKSFPCMSDIHGLEAALGTSKFLRLILLSPGFFDGGWVPKWLLPESDPAAQVPHAVVRGLPSSWLMRMPRLLQRVFLKPCSANPTPWVTVPGTRCRVRLRTAFVPGWIPVSGWDYEKRSQKPMRKLVPAGSVYVIEIGEQSQSGTVAQALWGKSLCVDGSEAHNQDARDGFGVVIVGCAAKLCRGIV